MSANNDRKFIIFFRGGDVIHYHENQTRDDVIKWVVSCGIDKDTKIVEVTECTEEFKNLLPYNYKPRV